MNRKWIVFLTTIGLFAAGLAVQAQYDGLDNGTSVAARSVPELIPYRGYLENGGSAFNGQAWFQFTIYDAPTGGTARWTEIQDGTTASATNPGITVSQGNFAVTLGSRTAFTTLVSAFPDGHPLFQQNNLYLEVGVRFASSGVFTVLSSQRQRILAAPYAMTARQAENFDVSGNVTLSATSTLTPPANLTVIGPFNAYDPISSGSTTTTINAPVGKSRLFCFLSQTYLYEPGVCNVARINDTTWTVTATASLTGNLGMGCEALCQAW